MPVDGSCVAIRCVRVRRLFAATRAGSSGIGSEAAISHPACTDRQRLPVATERAVVEWAILSDSGDRLVDWSVSPTPPTKDVTMNRSFERILAVAGASAVLVVGIDAVSYAATGKALILGHTNTANRTTTVRNTGNGAALSLITKKSTFAPFTTNATGQVPNLNASKVDGVTANQIRGHYALISISPSLLVSHSSGGVNATNPQTGIYCITVAGVNSTNTVATVTPDYFQDATTASAT
jgi:hypothetical protein